MKQQFVYKLLCIITFIFILAACSEPPSSLEDNQEIELHTSVYPIQYMAERIGGTIVNAETVFPPGTDAHTYEPSAKDLTKIAESDAFIYLGENLEAFAGVAARALQKEDVALISLADHEKLFETAETEYTEEHHPKPDDNSEKDGDGHAHGDHDPHIWLDPVRAITMAQIVKEELTYLAPEYEEQFEANYLSLAEDLQGLDHQFKAAVAGKKHKELLVSHAAYGYWEQRYGLEQIAINGITNQEEPSQKELIAIIEQARQTGINYIIFEQNVSDKVSKEVQEAIGAESLIVHNLAVLTENDIKNNEDYLTLMKQNIQVVQRALE